MGHHVPPPPPLPERPAAHVPDAWPAWARVLLAVAFWPLLVAVAMIAFRVTLSTSCTPATPGECELMRPPRAVMTVVGTLGMVAFFIGHVRFAGRARAVYLGTWLLLLLAWMLAMAWLPRVPIGIQVLTPVAFAFLLAWAMARRARA